MRQIIFEYRFRPVYQQEEVQSQRVVYSGRFVVMLVLLGVFLLSIAPVTAAAERPGSEPMIEREKVSCTHNGITIDSPVYIDGVLVMCEGSQLKCYYVVSSGLPELEPLLKMADCSEVNVRRRLETKGHSKHSTPGRLKAGTNKATTAVKSEHDPRSNMKAINSRKAATPTNGVKTAIKRTGNSTKPGAVKSPKRTGLKARSRASTGKTIPSDSIAKRASAKAKTQTGSTSTSTPMCMHKGTRIRGMQRVSDKTGRFYLICNELARPPTLTCYKDLRIADRRVPDPVVPCELVPPVSQINAKENTNSGSKQRRLAVWDAETPPWPLGFVCYEYVDPDTPPAEAQEAETETNEDEEMEQEEDGEEQENQEEDGEAQENQEETYAEVLGREMVRQFRGQYRRFTAHKDEVIRRVEAAMEEYRLKTGIQFITKETCKDLRRHFAKDNFVCGGCTHTVKISFVADPSAEDYGCWSDVGFGNEDDKESTQRLNLSYNCWKHATILHELGHTIGLDHDHQRVDREVIFDTQAMSLISTDWPSLRENVVIRGNWDEDSEYDRNSIMHYAGADICIRKDQYANVQFCDILDDPSGGCTEPVRIIHCDEAKDHLIGPSGHLSEGDIRGIQRLYRHEFELREVMPVNV